MHISIISQIYLEYISGISQARDISGVLRVYLRSMSCISQVYLRHILGISLAYLSSIEAYIRHISGIS